MKKEFLTFTSKVLSGVSRLMLLVALVAATPMFYACSEDPNIVPTPKPDPKPQGNPNGVVYNGESEVSCDSAQSSISFKFEADAGFELETNRTGWVEFVTPSQSSEGGSYNATVQVKKNSTKESRKANIYITVDGHERTLLFTITQDAPAPEDLASELVKYVDKRLVEEYYWLDEYKEKRSTFDFTLEPDVFLDESLASMETNIADGGYDSKGNRYVYSYFYQISGSRAASQVTGYGIVLSGYMWAMNSAGTEYGLIVSHVYPNSPAAAQGIQRGDIISTYNGSKIGSTNVNNAWYDIYYSLTSTVKLGVHLDGSQSATTISLSTGNYYENPVAHYDVYDLTDENDNVTKVGYLSFLSFDSDYTNDLVEALRYIDNQGIDEMILDLRDNGGGSVNMSTVLASSLISGSYNGQIYQTLVRHEDNPRGNTDCPISGVYNGSALPRLDINRLFVITSGNTASASEMVISGLRGLDIPVMTIGLASEGKNCGMDVTQVTDKTGTYEYAPITFLNFNAKGFNDFADGIPADRDMNYIAKNAKNEDVSALAGSFMWPMEPWGGYSQDMGMLEALFQIQGRSIVDVPADTRSSSMKFQPSRKHNFSRANGQMEPMQVEGKRIVKGATLTEEERVAFDSQSYK